MCFPIVLEARMPNPRCRDDWFLERTPSLACRWPPSVCVLIWLFLCVWDERTLVSFPLRTPVQSGQGSTLRISFHLSEVAQSCPTLCHPMDYSLPSSFVHEIFQARVLEWVAISFSRRSSWPRDQTWVSHNSGSCLTIWAPREATLPSEPPFHLN